MVKVGTAPALVDPSAIANATVLHLYLLEEAADAYETFARKRDDCLEPVLIPLRAAA